MQMHAGRQRVILYHEFLHVKRRDWRWQFAEEILRALFWFHPAVLWLIAQIRLTREHYVDVNPGDDLRFGALSPLHQAISGEVTFMTLPLRQPLPNSFEMA
jgi:hypothetical protein